MAFMGMSEELLPVFLPIIVYWVGAAVYQLTTRNKDHHRLLTKEEEETQNLATRRQVLVGVLINQTMQMLLVTVGFMSGYLTPAAATGTHSPSLLRAVGQMAVAMLVMDFWEYFWHRWTHENKFLYKHVHAMHHHLIVPYTYGSQYIHPVDAIVGEILGGLVTTVISGMSPTTAAIFFSLLQIKGLDDHCGMWFPNHPIHRWLANNAAFHTLHHQHVGIKSNYSVHFLATWDFLLGTYLPFTVEPRKEGGYQLQVAADKDQ